MKLFNIQESLSLNWNPITVQISYDTKSCDSQKVPSLSCNVVLGRNATGIRQETV